MRLGTLFSLVVVMVIFFATTSWPAEKDPEPEILAINILLDPDKIMIDAAVAVNELLRSNYPDGFALDTSHAPHITIVQRFVRAENLDKVFAAVSKVVEKEQPTQLDLTATDCYYSPYRQLGVVGITVQPTPELTAFQKKIIAAVEPFTTRDGTGAAFVPRKDGGRIDKQSVDYVKVFIGEYSGNNFNPHVTVGLGRQSFAKELANQPFSPFRFRANSVSIYQLGNLGTAQKKLWTSD
jgi:2'-5' RNA ligase